MIKAGHFNKKREVNAFECYTEELVLLFRVLLCEQSHRFAKNVFAFIFNNVSITTDFYKEV